MDFWFSSITLASIYGLLGLLTNLLVGITGIFSVSQAAVFRVGAYIVAYVLMNDLLSFLPALTIAAICCIALNILAILLALRVSGDYSVVTSFGIQLLATSVLTNWTGGSGGANGYPECLRPTCSASRWRVSPKSSPCASLPWQSVAWCSGW